MNVRSLSSRLSRPNRLFVTTLVLGLALLSLWPRIGREAFTPDEDGIYIWDNDTVRRLVRLDHLAEASTYPHREPFDGYPEGSVSHWTRPMDWVIVTLDALLPASELASRKYETGAIWAGPLLGALCVAVVGILYVRWMGAWKGITAAGFYAFSYTTISLTGLGNGDHQNLQHLFLAGAVLGLVCLVSGNGGRRTALASGACLGMALWVSTESMAMLAMLCLAALATFVCTSPQDWDRWVRLHATWAFACLGVCVLADRIEHPQDLWSFEWDKISGFQIAEVLLFLCSLGMIRWLGRRMPRPRLSAPLLAGAIPLGVTAALFAAIPSLGSAFAEQLSSLQESSAFTGNLIQEYHSLVTHMGVVHLEQMHRTFTFAIYALPLCLIGLWLNTRVPIPARLLVTIVASGSFVLACMEAKLDHFFILLFPAVILLGAEGLWGKFIGERGAHPMTRWMRWAGCVAFVALAIFQGPPWSIPADPDQAARRDLMKVVRDLEGEGSVLGLWSLGAHLMYYGDKPAVGTNYHRNIDGIYDSFRVLLATNWPEARKVLERRGVRWIVLHHSRMSFVGVERLRPSFEQVAQVVERRDPRSGRTHPQVQFKETFRNTLFVTLQTRPESIPGIRPIYTSPHKVKLSAGGTSQVPRYKIFEVQRAIAVR